MHEEYHTWRSPSIGKDFEMLVFGHAGRPVILFPTSKGAYYQNKDMGMIDAVGWFLRNGLIKIYCPDSVDALSWYAKDIPPARRAYNHSRYDNLIAEELIPRAINETGFTRVAMAGCSFGGYHAVNASFRHPHLISYCFSMSGAFDVKQFMDGYYDDNVYYNNPVDFIPGDNDPEIWQMGIVLGTSDQDICKADNERLSDILRQKNVEHWLDVRPDASHDWPVWREMFPHYLSLMK
ncbi:MAG: esterase [Bacteroidetes bacterium]|nr:MAG: esterase [Bacteroidota bacterium]